jgi:uncharacterized protein YabE (DUF348 family)
LRIGKNQALLPGRRALAISCIALILILGTIFFVTTVNKTKAVTLLVDGTSQSYETEAETVNEFLQEINFELDEADRVNHDLEAKLTDEAEIVITQALTVNITADWQTTTLELAPCTVAEALDAANISLNEHDMVSPGPTEQITDGSTITVNRIVYHTIEQTESIAPSVVRRSDASIEAGTTKVLQAGTPGSEKVTYAATYKDGKLVYKTELSRTTLTEAKDKIIAVGTMKTASRGGSTRNFSYSDSFTVTASAYTHTGNNTATGTKPAKGTVAVDPSVIPLGTRLYIEGYGYGVAADTGGAIKGKKIDVFFDTSSACYSWGRKQVKIYILD